MKIQSFELLHIVSMKVTSSPIINIPNSLIVNGCLHLNFAAVFIAKVEFLELEFKELYKNCQNI